MKRILAIILVALMALSVVTSCKKSDGGNSKVSLSKIEQSSSTSSENAPNSQASSSSSSSEVLSSNTSNGNVSTSQGGASSNSTVQSAITSASSSSSSVNSASASTSGVSTSSANTSSGASTSQGGQGSASVSTSTSSSNTSSNVTSSSSHNSAYIEESATQEEMEGSQVTASGFNYEDYRVTTSDYNRNLFYYNELLFEVADPTVIYIDDVTSSEYGYFYAYGTSDQIGCHGIQGWRSRDLTNWEDMGAVYMPDFSGNWAYTNHWAPDIIYDPVGMEINGTTYKYFMYYNAERYDASQNFLGGERDTYQYISVVYAESPKGPFIHPDGNINGKTYSVTSPVFDFTSANSAVSSSLAVEASIDANPFIDTDGTKYLYFSGWGETTKYNNYKMQNIFGVKMIDWFTPDYSTMSRLCRPHFMKVDDPDSAFVEHEGKNDKSWINEGSYMYKSGDTYMLTFSVYTHDSQKYQVRLATSNKPLEGFTKVDPYNGGTVIKTVSEWDKVVSSTGHHSFIQVGDELFIAYHTFKDRMSIAQGRALAVDKVEIIEVGGQKIMHTNGPSYSYQPLPSLVSGYENIASEATVSGDIASNKEGLTDGLIKYHTESEISDSVQEVNMYPNGTVTLEFNTYKNIRAIMAYVSSEYLGSINRVSSVKLTYKSPNGDKVIEITNSQFDYSKFYIEDFETAFPGGAAIIEFNELPIKKIELTFDSWGADFKLNEIVVLGSTAENQTYDYATDDYVAKKYQYTNALVPVAIKRNQASTIGSVRLSEEVQIHTTFGVDLTHDDGTADAYFKTFGPMDQFAFLRGVATDTIYYEAELSVYETLPYMGDEWPKLGLAIKTNKACTFLYIDAGDWANDDTDPNYVPILYENKHVGYVESQQGGGTWDWAATEEIKAAPSIEYKDGNFVKLAIARVENHFYFYCNGIKFFESEELRGLGAGVDAAYGFLCFNTGMIVKNYSYITDLNQINAKIAELQEATDAQSPDNKNFGTIDDTKVTAETWDLTNDYLETSSNYATRSVELTSTDNAGNNLYFKNVSGTTFYAEGLFQVTTGTLCNEPWGKFGFQIVDDNGKGTLFYVDCATDIEDRVSSVTEIISNVVGYGKRTTSGDVWGLGTVEKFDPAKPIKLAVFRQDKLVKLLVNDLVVFEVNADIEGAIYPSIFSYNIALEITEYRATTNPNDPMIDLLKEKVNTEAITDISYGSVTGTDCTEYGTWTKGNGVLTNTESSTPTAATYNTTVSGNKLYFQSDLSLTSVRGGDQWAKVGLYLRTETTELMFYVDAINGGVIDGNAVEFGTNKVVGIALKPQGLDWQFKQASNITLTTEFDYSGFTMGIYYDAGNIYLVLNGRVVLVQSGISGFGAEDIVYVGFISWSVNFTASNYYAVSNTAGLKIVTDELGITSGNFIKVDGVINDWTGTKTTAYSAYENDTVSGTKKGFKVMAFMGDKGVHVAYHAIADRMNASEANWWLNTNAEMYFYSPLGEKTVVYVTAKHQSENAGVYKFVATERTDGLYDIYCELFVAYETIGYTGQEDYVAGFFAFRPGNYNGTPDTGMGINGDNVANEWWTGNVACDTQSYEAALTTYKITANGLEIA